MLARFSNGEAVYGTTYGPWQNLPFGKSTAKGNTIYLHVFDRPKGSLELDPGDRRVTGMTLLATRAPLHFTQSGARLIISVPSEPPDARVSVLALTTP